MPPVKWLNDSLPKKRQSHLTIFNPPEQQEVVPLPRPPWRNKADFRTSSGTAAVAVDQRHPPPNSAGCWPQTVANGSGQLVGGFRNTTTLGKRWNGSEPFKSLVHCKTSQTKTVADPYSFLGWLLLMHRMGQNWMPKHVTVLHQTWEKPSSPAPQILMDIYIYI